jgi:hypothetical protein
VGEATTDDYYSTVHSAMQSGEEAADRIVESLKK